MIVLQSISFQGPLVVWIINQQLGELGFSNPLALHVLVRFYQVLTSALVQHIEGVDDRPFFQLPLVIILFINLKAHQISSFLNEYNFSNLLKFFLNQELCRDSSDFQDAEDGSNEI